MSKIDNENLKKAIQFLVYKPVSPADFDPHATCAISPSIQELRRIDIDLAKLFEAITGFNNENNCLEIRRKFRDEALPFLPSLCCGHDNFICRWVNQGDLDNYSNFTSESFTVDGGFMSFYLNGPSCGVPVSANGNCELICEDFNDVKFIGSLSQVPNEKEVIVEDRRTFKVQSEYRGINALLSSKALMKNSTIEFYSSLADEIFFNTRRYVYISETSRGKI